MPAVQTRVLQCDLEGQACGPDGLTGGRLARARARPIRLGARRDLRGRLCEAGGGRAPQPPTFAKREVPAVRGLGGGTGIARDAPELGLFRFRSGRPLPPVVVYLVDETGNVMDAQIEKFLRWQAWHPAARQWIACCRGVAAEAV